MKLICTVGLAIVVLLFAAACAEPQGQPDRRGQPDHKGQSDYRGQPDHKGR